MKPAWRILLTVVGVFVVALWPRGLWRWQLVFAALLLGMTVVLRLSLSGILRRCVLLCLLTGVMALGLAGRPDWLLRAGNLLLKSTLSLWTVSLLTGCTGLPELVKGLRELGIPRVWTEAFAFWGRYYSVLSEEWQRLQLARRARTIELDRRREFRALASALGLLFIRAYERAEQVHRAMLARGYGEQS